MLGDEKAATILKEAAKLHESRGYRYKYVILYAFGAYEHPQAASEIMRLTETSSADLIGRMGWVIQDNQTLKNSAEWASFLREFVLKSSRFGDEVKSRILHTIEEVKNTQVKEALETISRETSSQRLREYTKKILEKNFGGQGTNG